MDGPAGGLTTVGTETTASVVGAFRGRTGFEQLDSGVVVLADPATPARSLVIVAMTAAGVPRTQAAALTMLARADPADVEVTSPATLAEIQQAILGDLSGSNRLLVLLVLGTGAALSAVVVLSTVLMNRTDLGRRRALGASRIVLTALVVSRVAVVALPAVLLGTLVGVIALRIDGQAIPHAFTVAVLATLTAVMSAVPPALVAAAQDPVTVLRTP